MRLIFEFLIAMYPARFRNRVGDSMLQTLSDSYSEMTLPRKILSLADLAFGAVYENLRSIEERTMPKTILTPVLSATIGMLMIVPGISMFVLLLLGIEPPLGPLRPYLTAPPDVPNILGSLVALTFIVFLPVAGALLNYAVIRRSVLTEGKRSTFRANVIVAAVGLCLVAAFVAGVIVDQYPCWIGVPNCD